MITLSIFLRILMSCMVIVIFLTGVLLWVDWLVLRGGSDGIRSSRGARPCQACAYFGMPQPESFRKALRLMKLAERFKLPLITFIDTPGAYPGIGAKSATKVKPLHVIC